MRGFEQDTKKFKLYLWFSGSQSEISSLIASALPWVILPDRLNQNLRVGGEGLSNL